MSKLRLASPLPWWVELGLIAASLAATALIHYLEDLEKTIDASHFETKSVKAKTRRSRHTRKDRAGQRAD